MLNRLRHTRRSSAQVLGLVVCLSALCAAFRANAQQPGTTTLSVTTRLVVLDIVVLDNKGHAVTGVDRSQFSVYEDKVEQRIRSFEGPEGHAMPAGAQALVHSTADLARVGNAPVNVLVIDELNTPFANSARAQGALRHFLEQQPEVLPVPTLFLAAGASRVTVLHDFTQSRADLIASMKTHVTDVDFRALANQLAGGSMSAPDGFAKTLGALSAVASSLRGIRGHKNVIWVGVGFDNAYDLTSASDSDAEKIQAALALVTRRMLDARMSVSTLDPVGVDSLADQEDFADEATLGTGTGSSALTDFMQDVSFDELARSTGGTVVHGRNDLDRLITADANRAGDFYTLTYTPSNSSEAALAYRSVSVVMKDPNLHAITRTGYFTGMDEEPPVTPSKPKSESREFKFDMTSAGSSRMVYTGLRVTATKKADGYQVQVGAGELRWTPQGNSEDARQIAEVSVLGIAFNAKDKVLRQDAQEYKEAIRNTDQPQGKQVTLKFVLDVPPGATRVRFVVRDAATGTIGSFDLQP